MQSVRIFVNLTLTGLSVLQEKAAAGYLKLQKMPNY
jgi:hypothetical protein